MARTKPLKPSRPMLEVTPVLHASLKDAAGRAGMPLKEFTAQLLSNGLLRLASGSLQIQPPTPAKAIDTP